MAARGVFRIDRIPTKRGSSPLLQWTYYREYTCTEPAWRVFHESGEIDALRVKRAYKQRKEEGLWWWANVVAGISSSAAIRKHYARMLRRGIEEALKNRGYDRDGFRLARDGRVEGSQRSLEGSLQILGRARIGDDNSPWNTVKEECEAVVDSIIWQQSRPQAPADGSQRMFTRASAKTSKEELRNGFRSLDFLKKPGRPRKTPEP